MLHRTKREKEIFLDYLKRNGLKRTAQKNLILEVFLKTEGHLSVEDTHQILKQKDSSIGYVTVYRTLKSLVACGLAREVNLGDGPIRFEHSYNHPHHHHIICTNCKKTIEFLSTDIEQLQEEILKYYDFEPLYHSFQVFGLCGDCRRNKLSNGKTAKSHATLNDRVFLRDALRMVIRVETNGLNFYLTASERTKNVAGRAMFQKIANDEREHLTALSAKYDRLIEKNKSLEGAPQFLHFNMAILNHIFPPKEEVLKLIGVNTNDLQALAIAIESERESYEFFLNYAQRFRDSKGKKIFVNFNMAEKKHLTELESEYQKLAHEYRQRKSEIKNPH